MFLFGSRAIVEHLPDFRPPQDWDLVGTKADIARLDALLGRDEDQPQSIFKVHYQYDGRIIELIDGAEVPYWGRMAELFSGEPTRHDPVLGTMNLAPPGFLLLSKQCGLIYRIKQWHKNLEDLYFMRDRLPVLGDDIAALVEPTQAEARRVYISGHVELYNDVLPCHPQVEPAPSERHIALHTALALGARPAREEEGAWLAFPALSGDAKRQRMIDLFAEEAMVLAAEEHIDPRRGGAQGSPAELLRYSLRQLITGRLPESWRYFGVNYYRDITARIASDWPERIAAWPLVRGVFDQSCAGDENCVGEPNGDVLGDGRVWHPV